ncbi:MAG: hypothetical protein RLZZ214_1364 [Verrucomicrobiota bacterium]|jgi:hypothetical protein
MARTGSRQAGWRLALNCCGGRKVGLAAEGLVQLDDKMVTAVSLPEFLEALYVRPEFL